MPLADVIWGLLGSQQAIVVLLSLILAKQIDHDNNLANIIDALGSIEDAPDIHYETLFPVQIPRFHSRRVNSA